MRVTAEIAKGMLGPAKRPFAVDDPLLTKRLLDQLRKYFRAAHWFHRAMKAELTLSKDLLQGFRELTSEHFRQHIDRKKELWVR